MNIAKDPPSVKYLPLLYHREVQQFVGITVPEDTTVQGDSRFVKEGQIIPIEPAQDLPLKVEEYTME